MINTITSEDGKTATIQIKNELSLYNCEEAQKEIINALEAHSEIEIKIDEIENFDLSAVQLLYSMRKTAEKQNKKINISLNLPKDIKVLLEHAGFDEITKIQ